MKLFVSAKQRFDSLRSRLSDDRGDVPGWVLVTLMTAGLVVLLWGLAGPAMKGIFDQALNKVAQF
jgi:hypothetical protein